MVEVVELWSTVYASCVREPARDRAGRVSRSVLLCPPRSACESFLRRLSIERALRNHPNHESRVKLIR